MNNSTKGTADEEGIQRLLHDIDVELNNTYAAPKRVLFPELSPYYARLGDYPLVERLALSAKAAKDSEQGMNFRRYVSAALHRAADIPLGNSRTLVLIDLAHKVAVEAFSDLLLRRLLWRADQTHLPIWIGDLAIRFEEWLVNLDLDTEDWKRLIESVEPLGFESLLRWSFLQARNMSPPARQIHLQQTMSIAAKRLLHDSQQFSANELDPLETQARLSQLLLDKWNFSLNLSEDQTRELEETRAKESLRRDIARTQYARDRNIERRTADDEVDFPLLEMT